MPSGTGMRPWAHFILEFNPAAQEIWSGPTGMQTSSLRCEWGAGVFDFVLSLSLSHTGHWKFNMAPHGKELLKKTEKKKNCCST